MDIVLIGAGGRMGHSLRQVIDEQGDQLVGAVAATPDKLNIVAPCADRLTPTMLQAEVLIDFSTPQGTEQTIETLEQAPNALAYVVGTTGLSEQTQERLKNLARRHAVLYTANTSIGITVMKALATQAAKMLPGYDIDIGEMHHSRKVDAPSGTALTLGDAVAQARGAQNTGSTDRAGTRKENTIGYAVMRGGTVAGEHTVVFSGPYERLEIIHRAQDRTIFARGALRAAAWLLQNPPGFYEMNDVLGVARTP
ncbi:MAG: 4-hydroxy-tetrahydrodipicolinate reductase [Pseudomonadota bacterium]